MEKYVFVTVHVLIKSHPVCFVTLMICDLCMIHGNYDHVEMAKIKIMYCKNCHLFSDSGKWWNLPC